VVIAIDAAPVRWLGDLSYSIYLWQGLFLTTGPAGATDWFQRWPVNALLILPAAAASYYLVERPFLRQRHPGVIG
jgi:peptidoglycan/LPS O-acetylase OafA/YrhL